MEFWITRTSRESYMLTTLPPRIERVIGSDRRKAYVDFGDPVGVKNLCAIGVQALVPGLRLEVLETTKIKISANLLKEATEGNG